MDNPLEQDKNGLSENLLSEFDYDSTFAQVEEKVMNNIRNQREDSQQQSQQQIVSRINLGESQDKPKVAKPGLLISRKLSKHSASLEAIRESSKETRTVRKTVNSEGAESSLDRTDGGHRQYSSKRDTEKIKPGPEGSRRDKDGQKRVNFKAKRVHKVCGVNDSQLMRKSAHHRPHNCSFTAGLEGHISDAEETEVAPGTKSYGKPSTSARKTTAKRKTGRGHNEEESFHHLSASEVEECHHKATKERTKHKNDAVYSHKHKTKHRTIPCTYAALISDTMKETRKAQVAKSGDRQRLIRQSSATPIVAADTNPETALEPTNSNAISRLWDRFSNMNCC